MNRHISYDKIRKYALEFACDAYKVSDETLKDEILNSHTELTAYPDAPAILTKLKQS